MFHAPRASPLNALVRVGTMVLPCLEAAPPRERISGMLRRARGLAQNSSLSCALGSSGFSLNLLPAKMATRPSPEAGWVSTAPRRSGMRLAAVLIVLPLPAPDAPHRARNRFRVMGPDPTNAGAVTVGGTRADTRVRTVSRSAAGATLHALA